MARRVFFSFYYKADCTRAAKIRNIGVLEGNEPASDNEWESIWKGGDLAIEAWIDGQMEGRTCTVVLIGSQTAGRRWINYEIKKSWRDGKGLLGIYVHNIPDLPNLQTSYKGANPFDEFILSQDGCTLSDYASKGGPVAQVGLGGLLLPLLCVNTGKRATSGNHTLGPSRSTTRGRVLSDVVMAYDPPYTDSRQVYAYIQANIAQWIDKAIQTRAKYSSPNPRSYIQIPGLFGI